MEEVQEGGESQGVNHVSFAICSMLHATRFSVCVFTEHSLRPWDPSSQIPQASHCNISHQPMTFSMHRRIEQFRSRNKYLTFLLKVLLLNLQYDPVHQPFKILDTCLEKGEHGLVVQHGLSDHSAERKHGESSILELANLVLLQSCGVLTEAEGVKSKVTYYCQKIFRS